MLAFKTYDTEVSQRGNTVSSAANKNNSETPSTELEMERWG